MGAIPAARLYLPYKNIGSYPTRDTAYPMDKKMTVTSPPPMQYHDTLKKLYEHLKCNSYC